MPGNMPESSRCRFGLCFGWRCHSSQQTNLPAQPRRTQATAPWGEAQCPDGPCHARKHGKARLPSEARIVRLATRCYY